MGYKRKAYDRINGERTEGMHGNGNYVFCVGAQKSKLLFASEAKAKTFMKFNYEAIMEEKGYAPCRAYYCECCGGWHLTHRKAYHANMDFNRDAIVESYREEQEMKRMAREEQQERDRKRAEERRMRKKLEQLREKNKKN